MRCAVVGSGPAGMYTVQSLLKLRAANGDPAVASVAIFERRGTPFGLLQFGVAPDHTDVRNTKNLFNTILEDGRVALHLESEVNHLSTLYDAYDDVFLCTGATAPKSIHLHDDVISGRNVVSWYNADDVHDQSTFPPHSLMDASTVSIIGNGNVSLDIARMLLTGYGAASSLKGVDRVNIVARRGPLDAAWTTKELREITSIPEIHTHVEHEGPLPPFEEAPRKLKRMLQLLHDIHAREDDKGQPKRLELHFNSTPLSFDPSAKLMETSQGPVASDCVIESVGFTMADAMPADPPIPVSEEGHYVNEHGFIRPHLYCTGWCKRGSKGIIADNKWDAE